MINNNNQEAFIETFKNNLKKTQELYLLQLY